jgi:hypothetical protein
MSAIREEVYMEDGVLRLEPRVARIESDVGSLKETVTRLDKKFDERFDKLDGKVNGIDKRMAVMEHGFDDVRRHQANLNIDLRDLRRSLDAKFIRIVTTMIAFGAALLAAMAKGFHWLD